MVINTNVQALRTSNILNASNRSLGESLARLSSGSKIVNPSDDAAGVAVSSRLKAQVSRVNSALSNIGNAISFTQTQDGVVKTAAGALRRMGELALLAQDVTKSNDDRALYDAEYQELVSFLTEAKDKTFNGVSLFGANANNMVVDEDGTTFAASAINLDQAMHSYSDYAKTTEVADISMDTIDATTGAVTADATVIADVLESNVLTSNNAADSLTLIQNSTTAVAELRARLGAAQSRLNYSQNQLEITKENLSSSISRITDVNMAEESTNYSKYQILVNSGTAMLTQANTLPQAALRLIQ